MRGLGALLVALAVPLVTCGQAAACCGDFLDAGGSASAPARQAPPGLGHQAAALGLHAVTTVYAGTSVATQGDTTTYSAVTRQQDAGTFAKRVASTGTGESTLYDALSSNARPVMSDGSLVAGDFYANYVVRGGAIVFDRFVFFADDSETRRRAAATPAPAAAPPPAQPPQLLAAPTPLPVITRPSQDPVPLTLRPAPAMAEPPPVPAPAPPAPPPAPRDVRAGVALGPQADPLASAEVLRGRRIALWMRATVDGSPARVIDWRLASGELTALGPVSGTGDQPLVATWPQLPPRGSTFAISVDVRVEVQGSSPRTVRATIEVAVRSPAIVE